MNETTIQANIADTIAQQLGGTGRLAIMIGAKYFVALENGLRFRIMRNASGGNLITITLTGADLYDVKISSVRGVKETTKKEISGIYASDVRNWIEQATGLYLTLGTMGR
jgi:hypothetical protein